MNEIAERYRTLADAFEAKIADVRPDQWSNRSPCSEWDARGVVDHVVGTHGWVLQPLDRPHLSGPAAADDPLGAFQTARAEVEKVLDDPALAGQEYDGALGRTSVGATVDQFLGFDLVVHGWDLARATGQADTIDPDEVERIWAMAQGLGDNLRRPGVCAAALEVAEDAPLQDRLLGLLGRDPRWVP